MSTPPHVLGALPQALRGHVQAAELASVTSPAPRGEWRQLLAADLDALAFHSPEWLDAICASGRYEDATRLYETRGGARVLLPLARRSGPWPNRIAPQASLPQAWGTGGLVADAPVTRSELAAIAADLGSLPALLTAIRPNPLQADLWAAALGQRAIALPRCAHVLDLDGGPEQVWGRRFRSAARRGVRKAERGGLDIECGTSDRLIDAFHGLLRLSFDRWARAQNEPLALARWRGGRRDPVTKFGHMARAMGNSMRLWVAWKDGAPVASILVLLGVNASYTRGAMNKELAGPTAANDLLHWLAIQDACEAGCRHYHMGESGSSGTLSRYKEKFGARPVDYSEYRIERVPLTRADELTRHLVKRALRFRDA